MTIDDFVLSPRRVKGKLYAERLMDGEAIELDVRMYDRTPLIYKGRQIWAHVDTMCHGIPARELVEAINAREKNLNDAPDRKSVV